MKEQFINIFNTLRNNVKFENTVLFLYLIKCLTISVSYEDAIVLVSLVALKGFKTYNSRFEIKDSLDEKYKKETADEIKDLKQAISVMRLGSGPRQQQENGKRYF
jgi:hypothetical protein